MKNNIYLIPLLKLYKCKIQRNTPMGNSFIQLIALPIIIWLLSSQIGSAQIAPNTYTPIVVGGGGGTFTSGNLTARSSEFGILPPFVPVFASVGNVIDDNLSGNSAQMNNLALGNGWIEVDYSGGFLAGTDVGFVVDKGLLSIALLSSITVSTYSTSSGEVAVETKPAAQLLGVGVGADKEKIGFVATQNFRRVRIEFSGLNLGALLTPPRVYYAEVMVPQAGALSSTCNTTNALNQSNFPAVANYGISGLLGGLTSADIGEVLNNISNLENVVSSSTTDYATVSPANASILGAGYLAVKLLEGSVPKDYYGGFEIENTIELLNVNLLNGITIQAYNDGNFVQSRTAYEIFSASILSGGTSKQAIGFVVTNGSFDELRLVFSAGLLSANASVLGQTRIYGAIVKSFCPPSAPLPTTTILANGHTSANGMGVSVNETRSGLADIDVLEFSQSVNNLIDNNPNNYVSINNTLNISAINAASVAVTTPGHTFINDEYVGFVVKAASPLVNLNLLTGTTIKTYKDGVLVETATVANGLLRLNLLDLLVINGAVPPDAQILYFKTESDFDEVELEVSSLVGIGSELQVYSAFVSASASLPVNFGAISAISQNGKLIVNWSTLFETNSTHFIIEGSIDGQNWNSLGTLVSKAKDGVSDKEMDYSFEMSLSSIIKLSSISLGSALIIVLLLGALYPISTRKRYTFVILLSIVVAAGFISCQKAGSDVNEVEKNVAFVRVGEVDADGLVSYSKIIRVIEK